MYSALSLLGLATLTSATPFWASSDVSLETRQTTCAPLQIMIAPGCGIPCTTHGAGKLASLLTDLLYHYPTASQYIVPYDNSTIQAREATPVMVAAVEQAVATCPKTPIVFIGYSLGGIVVMNTLCGALPASYAGNIAAATVYGEETYTYPEVYDVGTCTANAPQYPRANAASACAAYAPVLQSWCNYDDPKCCTGGTNNESHYTYPSLYDSDATNYIVSKVSAWTAPTTEPTPPPTSSASSSTAVVSTSSSATSVSTTVISTTVSTSSVSSAPVSSAPSSSASGSVSSSVPVYSNSSSSTSTTTVVVGSTVTETTSTTGVPPPYTTGSTSAASSISASYPGSSGSSVPVSGSGAPTTTPVYFTPSVSATFSYETSSAIPLTGIAYSSSVDVSIQSEASSIISAISKSKASASSAAASATATATGSSGSGSGSGSGSSSGSGTVGGSSGSSTTPSVATYTGAASSMEVSSFFGLMAGVAATFFLL